MKAVILSDIHYISRRSYAEGVTAATKNETLVSEQALYQAAAENCGTMIITGDLTDRGDRCSHEDLAAILRDIQSKGTKVFVLFATHDFNHHRAFVRKFDDRERHYRSAPWTMPYFDPETADYAALISDDYPEEKTGDCAPGLLEPLSPEEIWETYREFGVNGAYSVFEPDFSYCADLDEHTRVLMLNDIFRNEEALADISASYTPRCFQWIKRMKDEAQRDGKFIFACTHHPLMPVVPAHRIATGPRNLRTPYTAEILADIGIELVFVGHTHAVDTGFIHTVKGNTLCSVMTPSVRFYPPQYRTVELDGAAHRLAYDCVDVRRPEGFEGEEDLTGYYRRLMYEDYYRRICGKDAFLPKLLRKLTLGDIAFLWKRGAKLTAAEYDEVKNVLFFDFVIELAFNMLTGRGDSRPGTAKYKTAMSLAAVIDSVILSQPFYDVKGKIMKGYTAAEVIEPMLYTDGVPNVKADFDFTKEPVRQYPKPCYSSRAGDFVMAAVFALTVAVSPLLPPAVIGTLTAKTLKKKFGS